MLAETKCPESDGSRKRRALYRRLIETFEAEASDDNDSRRQEIAALGQSFLSEYALMLARREMIDYELKETEDVLEDLYAALNSGHGNA